MDRVLALTASELRLILRNRTVLISTVAIPLGLGLFIALTNQGDGGLGGASLVAMQLALVLGMGIYVTATQTIVARRQSLVLKRLRTSGISDGGLLVATIAPASVLALAQLVLFGIFDVVLGIAMPTSPLALVLALVGGLALVVTAALATTVVTTSAERAQITTLPLFFVMIGAAVALALIPLSGWFQAIGLVPGAAIGVLTNVAYGGAWSGALVPVAALVLWPLLFGVLARRRFRWDPRAV
ncbi:MAG: ABC transporter permease [Pseudonocardia sp.]|nr:ABC transporter permease [Pseudonocardia sp.]